MLSIRETAFLYTVAFIEVNSSCGYIKRNINPLSAFPICFDKLTAGCSLQAWFST